MSSVTGRRYVWAAGLLVAAGAGTATAHGLYQVAAAAGVPRPIAWLYPLITDGLALVAYAATSRSTFAGRRYAAAIVVLAAGLSGLAQATYLTGSLAHGTAGARVPALLRFGVGAWPAVAAALTAHLLHLIGASAVDESHATMAYKSVDERPGADVQSPTARVAPPSIPPSNDPAVQPASANRSAAPPNVNERRGTSGAVTPARDRARAAACDHQARHGGLPTVSELMTLAGVARGTAGTVLKELRESRPSLHVVSADLNPRTTP